MTRICSGDAMPVESASKPIRKLLVANRSEIAIRVFRSATELGIRTVAIYSHEDRFALHRFKADEAYRIAQLAKVPILSGSDAPIRTDDEARVLAETIGYPVMVKASMGGGGRGMRPVMSADQMVSALDQARREAGAAFGVADVFLEK